MEYKKFDFNTIELDKFQVVNHGTMEYVRPDGAKDIILNSVYCPDNAPQGVKKVLDEIFGSGGSCGKCAFMQFNKYGNPHGYQIEIDGTPKKVSLQTHYSDGIRDDVVVAFFRDRTTIYGVPDKKGIRLIEKYDATGKLYEKYSLDSKNNKQGEYYINHGENKETRAIYKNDSAISSEHLQDGKLTWSKNPREERHYVYVDNSQVLTRRYVKGKKGSEKAYGLVRGKLKLLRDTEKGLDTGYHTEAPYALDFERDKTKGNIHYYNILPDRSHIKQSSINGTTTDYYESGNKKSVDKIITGDLWSTELYKDEKNAQPYSARTYRHLSFHRYLPVSIDGRSVTTDEILGSEDFDYLNKIFGFIKSKQTENQGK
jgi:hypothetical protein